MNLSRIVIESHVLNYWFTTWVRKYSFSVRFPPYLLDQSMKNQEAFGWADQISCLWFVASLTFLLLWIFPNTSFPGSLFKYSLWIIPPCSALVVVVLGCARLHDIIVGIKEDKIRRPLWSFSAIVSVWLVVWFVSTKLDILTAWGFTVAISLAALVLCLYQTALTMHDIDPASGKS